MSVIAASRIPGYLEEDTAVIACHADGSIWRSLLGAEVKVLAEKLMITGRGSRSRLKCVILNTGADQAEVEMERGLRAAAVRGRLAQSEASLTGTWESWSNHIGTVTVFKHMRNEYFPQHAMAGRGA